MSTLSLLLTRRSVLPPGCQPSSTRHRYPLFRDEFDATFLEGDLVLAIYVGRLRGRVYSSGHQRDTVRRFAARVDDVRQRRALDALFAGDGDLAARLEQAYSQVEGDRHRFERGPSRLFDDHG